MATIPKFRIATRIFDTDPPYAVRDHSVYITAHSIDDAGRRVMAALNLIDEAKEEAQDGDRNQD